MNFRFGFRCVPILAAIALAFSTLQAVAGENVTAEMRAAVDRAISPGLKTVFAVEAHF